LIRLRYLFVFILPLTVILSFNLIGIWTFLTVFVFFGLIPIIELLFKPNHNNFSPEIIKTEKEAKFYDWILYLAVFVQIAMLIYFLNMISDPGLTNLEIIGHLLSMGMMCGVFGINIGHELGHRKNRAEQFLAEISLLTSLDTHFLPYHNAGHHKNVSTPNDSATAAKGEILYLFWIKSHFGSYLEAWKIENNRLRKQKKRIFSLNNRMIAYSIANMAILSLIYFVFGMFTLLCFISAATIGILLLETINYIEHYGLLRIKNENGKYENVTPIHSWNSDHILGRLLLFNLSRHSDHHYMASKKYQILNSIPESPQMPTGYPGMVLFSLIQPLWFIYMNRHLANYQNKN